MLCMHACHQRAGAMAWPVFTPQDDVAPPGLCLDGDLMRELDIDPHSRLDSGTFATVRLGMFRGQQVGHIGGTCTFFRHIGVQ